MRQRLSAAVVLAMIAFSSCQPQASSTYQSPGRGMLTTAGTKGDKPMVARDPIPLIQQFHKNLMQRSPELIRTKYQAMTESPFAFYRATAFLYYYDVARLPELNSALKPTLQGDFHLENLGTYRTTQGAYAYDLNDFDEAFQGPFTWELLRGAVSIELAADEVGFGGNEREELVAYFVAKYVEALRYLQRNPGVLAQPLTASQLSKKPAEAVADAAEFNRAEYLGEMTAGGRLRLNDKIMAIAPAVRSQVEAAIQAYAMRRREGATFFKVKDAAQRVAGKGSLGAYRYAVLVEGASASPGDDLILEIKEAFSPSAVAFARPAGSNGQRIANAFHYFLPQFDPLLGLTTIHGSEAYVRELLPKETVNLAKVNKKSEYREFLDTVALAIARAHARSGQTAGLLTESSKAGFAERLVKLAHDYANQVEADYVAFRQALQSRKL